MKQIIIEGIPIEINKKKIKNMYLRVLPPDGKVQVSAPVRMTEQEIKEFIRSRLDWIIIQQKKIKKRHLNENIDYLSGDPVYLWGNRYILEIVNSAAKNNIRLDDNRVLMQTKPESTVIQREGILNIWYREELKVKIPELIEKWEKIIGVKANDWSIRDMKTRWGTCNVRSKRICLNLQLAKKPPNCLEYVVVHELVHLLEASHNKVFKGYMDRFMPDCRLIKKEMNGAE